MKKVMRFFLPKEKKFFEMLSDQSETALEASKELGRFVSEYENTERDERKQKIKSLNALKEKNGEAATEIMHKLSKSFRAPIDKEDIALLSFLIYDITRLTHAVSSRLVILGIERIDDYSPKLISVANKCINEVNKSIKNLDRPKGMDGHFSNMTGIRNEAEKIYDEALSELFHFYKNSLDIIKYREVYNLIEKMIEKSFEVSYVIGRVFAKHR